MAYKCLYDNVQTILKSAPIPISATIIAYTQLDYLKERDIGLDISHKIALNPIGGANRQISFEENFQNIKESFLSSPDISAASAASNFIGHTTNTWAAWLIQEGDDKSHNMNFISRNQDFLNCMDLKIIAGTVGFSDHE